MVCGYIADVFSKSARMVLEADGGYHDAPHQVAYDLVRDKAMQKAGYVVLRFRNEVVLNAPRMVAEAIAGALRPEGKEARRQVDRLKDALADLTWNTGKMPPVKKVESAAMPTKKPRKREVWLEALEKIVAHGCVDCAEWAAEALRYKGAPE